jgi:hypothetical protein
LARYNEKIAFAELKSGGVSQDFLEVLIKVFKKRDGNQEVEANKKETCQAWVIVYTDTESPSKVKIQPAGAQGPEL